MNCRIIVLLAVFAWQMYCVSAQEIKSVTLKEAKDFALKNNSSIKMSQNDLLSARMKVRETTAIGLPQVKGNISYKDFIKQPVSLVPAEFFGGQEGTFAEITFGTEQNATAEIQASQLVFDGSYIVGLQTTKTFLELSKLNLEKTELDIEKQIAHSYATALLAEKSREILSKNIVFMNANLEETKEMYNKGILDVQDVEQLQLMVSEMRNKLDDADRQLALSYDMLKLNMGLKINDSIRLSDSFDQLIKAVENNNNDSSLAVSNNVEYKLLVAQQQLALLSVKNEKMKYFPNVNAFISHQENAYRNEFNFFDGKFDWFPTTVWGINVNVPIFSSFMRNARVQQAKLQLENVSLNKNEISKNLTLSEMLARSNLDKAISEYNNGKENLKLAERIRDKTALKYKEGMASSLQLSQSETQLLSVQNAYVLSMFNMFNAKAELDNILGKH